MKKTKGVPIGVPFVFVSTFSVLQYAVFCLVKGRILQYD